MNTEKIMEDIQSVQDNIREIKSTWGNTIMTLDNIKSGLKADVQKKVDEAYKRGYNDAKQNAGEEYQRGYCEGYKKCLSENDFDQPCASCGDYQRGLDDAWETAKKIALMDTETSEKVTGYFGLFRIMENLTPMQAIEKIKNYEDKRSDRIEVGDIVDVYGNLGVVTYMYELKACVMMVEDGSSGNWNLNELKKTGKHYDIQSILEAMQNVKGEDNA